MLTAKIANTNSNQQTFKGKVIIDGDLSAIPTKMVRQSAQNLKKMFEQKDYDLFIKQDYKRNKIVFTVTTEKDYNKQNNFPGIADIEANETTKNVYETAAKFASYDYKNSMWNKLFINPPKTTFIEKLKKYFNK